MTSKARDISPYTTASSNKREVTEPLTQTSPTEDEGDSNRKGQMMTCGITYVLTTESYYVGEELVTVEYQKEQVECYLV